MKVKYGSYENNNFENFVVEELVPSNAASSHETHFSIVMVEFYFYLLVQLFGIRQFISYIFDNLNNSLLEYHWSMLWIKCLAILV